MPSRLGRRRESPRGKIAKKGVEVCPEAEKRVRPNGKSERSTQFQTGQRRKEPGEWPQHRRQQTHDTT